ncbi:MAG: hypothetical protein KJ000_23080 [Pirellulaceae bacterium]|nr:hypothetical protein [Pirellulaceae bacterium]
MRTLRWGMLALYAALVIGLCAIGLWPDNDLGVIIVFLIAIGSQAIFLLGAGHRDLCRPIRRPRLLLPATMAALMLAVLTFGLTLALAELLKLNQDNPGGVYLWGCLAVSWIVWSVLLFAHTRELGRFQAIQRLARYVFTGSLAELLAGIPAHIFVERRGGCFAGIGTAIGIFAGLGVMLWSFGPAILLLFLQPAYERAHDESPIRDRPARPRRSDYQFRLRTLLVITVALSVILALLKTMWGQWLGASLAAVLIIYLAVTVLMRIPVVLILVAVAVHAGVIWFLRDNWQGLALFAVPLILLSLPILRFFTRSSPEQSCIDNSH